MKCPNCGATLYASTTINTHDNKIIRNRHCHRCGKKYKTKEKITEEYTGYGVT